MNSIIGTVSAAVLLWMAAPAAAQSCPQERTKPAEILVYSISEIVDSRSIPTNNFTRGSKTKVFLEGTSNMPNATGDARVEEKTGYVGIDASFNNLQPAMCVYGPDYLTYVMWAITPEGRATNLGEVILTGKNDNKAKLNVTTEFQAFGLMVTAEPHFAVSRPSNVVVLQNIALPEPVATCGCCDPCAQGGGGVIVRGGGEIADKTEDAFDKSEDALRKGVDAVPGVNIDSNSPRYSDQATIDFGLRSTVAQARNAVKIATAAGASQYAPDILAKANSLLSKAEDQNSIGAWARTDSFAREAAQTAEDARIMSMQRMALADALAARSFEKAEAGVIVGESVALAETERALMKSEQEKAALRAKLAQQLNMIMTTRETVRGLIVDMADVRFNTAKYELKSTDKEKLAKVAGILLAYPDLYVEVDGYTDNTGTTTFNQTLSEQRAQAVRDYLISQGIPASRITAKGFGETMPTASNDTAEGRQKNRRVELVVAGETIGISINGTIQ